MINTIKFSTASNLYTNLNKERKEELRNIAEINLSKIHINLLNATQFKYPQWIEENKLWYLYGYFIEKIINRIISKYKKKEVEDTSIIYYITKNKKIDFKILINCNEKDLKNKYQLNLKERKFLKSYKKFINLDLENIDIIDDIFNISIVNSILNGREEEYKYFNNKGLKIDINIIENIEKYFINLTTNSENILINPILGGSELCLGADADFIIDDIILDIKVSKIKTKNIAHIMQQFIYVSLYNLQQKKENTESIKKINKIKLYNPLLNIEYNVDITDWNRENEIIDFIKKNYTDILL